jgi:rhamnogalacturonyl hydrolase YesR
MFNALLFGLAGLPVPKAAFFNEDIVYRALDTMSYRPGSGEIRYPSPNDWGSGRKMHFALMDCQVHAFGMDGLGREKGDYWEALHAAAVLKMQERGKDGRTYESLKEDNYKGREEWVAMQSAQTWLTHWLEQQGGVRITNEAYPHLTTVGNGWASNSVNTVIFRHNSLVTWKDTQYIAYYDSAQNLVLGRRRTGSSQWEVRVTQYKGDATDAHRSISIMVDGGGYLHVSWNHHNNGLHYCRSVRPGSLELGAEMPMTGKKEQRVSYPEFYRLANGNLLFFYRDGSSGNGDLMLDRYDWKKQRWTQVQDGWVNGEGQRNAYWQMTTDKQGVIHLSWVWRETGDVATNHDLCYAKSRDEGRTWEKSNGERYRLPITAATAEYACKIPQNSELINTTTMAADDAGHPYIATYWRQVNESVPQYRLVYNDGKQWKVQQVSDRKQAFSLSGGGTKRIPISRPKVMVSNKDGRTRVLMIFRDEERRDKISVASTEDLAHGGWKMRDLTTSSVGLWEPSYDTELWRQQEVLNLFVEKVEQGDGEKLKVIAPQPVQVLEWRPDWGPVVGQEAGHGAWQKKDIQTALRKVADWQIDSLAHGRFRWPVNEWVYATFYKGLWEAAGALHEQRYIDQLMEYCKKADWKVGKGEQRDFADNYCIGEVYCDLWKKYRQPEMIADFRAMADSLVRRPHVESLEYKNKIYFREWAWCDALFMGPASLAALSAVTKDASYLRLEDSLFWRTYDYLYDKQENLYYRDSRFFTEKEANGAKKFWSRGNGWVMAGLARLLQNMPRKWPTRGRYEQLFREMAEKVAFLQQQDGMWRASLLDPADFPARETSGTGLFCYALAWGIHHGLLDRSHYMPVVSRAWDALNACVHPDGKLGYVQMIADKPGVTDWESSDAYGVGAYLMAGTEILALGDKEKKR